MQAIFIFIVLKIVKKKSNMTEGWERGFFGARGRNKLLILRGRGE